MSKDQETPVRFGEIQPSSLDIAMATRILHQIEIFKEL